MQIRGKKAGYLVERERLDVEVIRFTFRADICDLDGDRACIGVLVAPPLQP